MSWADDIRCLYCDGRLPLYRKITNGQFCNAAHRKAYWQEQERLAVERLQQTHDSLRVFRPQGTVEQILGYPAAAPEIAPDAVPELGRLMPPRLLPRPDASPAPQPESVDWINAPLCSLSSSSSTATRLPVASEVEMGLMERMPHQALPLLIAGEVTPFDAEFRPVCSLPLSIPLQTDDLQSLLDEQVPQSETLKQISMPAAREKGGLGLEIARQPLPVAIAMYAQLPLDAALAHAKLAPAALVEPGLRALPINWIPLVQGAWIDSLRAVDLHIEPETPQVALATPAWRPRLKLAAGSRYSIGTQAGATPIVESESAAFSAPAADISLPERKGKIVRAAPAPENTGDTPVEVPEPSPTGLLPLACTARASQPPNEIMAAQGALSIPQPPRTEMMRPVSRLEPLDAKPVADFMPAPPPPSLLIGLPEPPAAPEHRTHVWAHAVDFWKNAPRDLKMLVFAIPVLLGLALHPSLPKWRSAAPATASGVQRNFGRALNTQWLNVRQSMHDRAGVALDEDFRSGLDEWVSRGDATTEWSFDATGFVRPGPLALYRPSIGLTDYQMQFLGLIDKKAMSWVVRAADFNNYYVVKLMVLKPGPLPTIGVTRYAVVDGKPDSRVDTIAPIDARPDMLYRVLVDAHGDSFSLTIQGQMVDSWSEPRLRHGGVGFFSARGEESRLRWVQVTHQYDMLGRLCAYLAPYNISSTNGSWQP